MDYNWIDPDLMSSGIDFLAREIPNFIVPFLPAIFYIITGYIVLRIVVRLVTSNI